MNTTAPALSPDFKMNLKLKKRKDKKRTKSESSIVSGSILGATSEHIDNINAYVGVPLVNMNIYIIIQGDLLKSFH